MLWAALAAGADQTICRWKVTSQEEADPINPENFSYRNVSYDDFFKDAEFRAKVHGKLYKRSVLKGIYFEESCKYSEDLLFNAYVTLFQKFPTTTELTGGVLYYYYQRPDSAVRTVSPEDRVKTGAIFLRKVGECKTDRQKYTMIVYCLRTTLLLRYLESVKHNHAVVVSCNKILKAALNRMAGIRRISPAARLQWTTLVKFPQIYRKLLIMRDKTYLDFEKAQDK